MSILVNKYMVKHFWCAGGLIILLGCAHELSPLTQMSTPVIAADQIRQYTAKVALLPATALSVDALAGCYSCPGPTLQMRCGSGESGVVLSLLRDGSYVCSDWSDITAVSTNEMGRWEVVNGFVELTRVWIAADEPMLLDDLKYLPLTLTGVQSVLLMGARRDFSYYLEQASKSPRDAEDLVLIRSLEKESR